MTQAAVRALTKQAEAASGGDRNEVVLGLDARVRERWGDFESFPLSIVRSESLSITLTTPFMGYRRAVAEHLRMREPLAEVPWVDDAVISVAVERLDAPDITKVTVTRDGKDVQPRHSALRPMTFTNGNGESGVLHSGDLRFPMSAFAPGATVTITAVPATGEPVVLTLNSERLAVLR
jgi:hypothetical protein